MTFITARDYDTHIRREHLLQLAEQDIELLDRSERLAEGTVKNYLRGKFDLEAIFFPIDDWSIAKTYLAGDFVRHNELIYEAVQDNTGVEPVPGTITADWKPNDRRSIWIIDCLIVISLFYLHKVISPANIPDHRQDDYNRVMKELTRVQKGELDAGLPKLEDINTKPVIVSEVKQQWHY
jgi:hypothetical protein